MLDHYWATGPIWTLFTPKLPDGTREDNWYLIETTVRRLTNSPPTVSRLPTQVSPEIQVEVRDALRALSGNEHLNVVFLPWSEIVRSEIGPIKLGGTDEMVHAAKTYHAYAFDSTSLVPRFGIDEILGSLIDSLIGASPSVERRVSCEKLIDFANVGLVVGMNPSGEVVVMLGAK